MPEYVEIFRPPAHGGEWDDEDNVPFRALNFFRHEGFEIAHRDCTVLDIEDPAVTVYFRTENFGGAYIPNVVGTALLWYWHPKDQPLTRVYGDLTVTGLRDQDGHPTPLDEETLELLTAPHEYYVTLAHVTQPANLKHTGPARMYFVDAALELCQFASFMTLSGVRFVDNPLDMGISATYE